MTREALIKIALKNIEDLENQEEPVDEKQEFLKDFLDSSSSMTLRCLASIDPTDALLAVFATIPSLCYEDVMDCLEGLRPILSNPSVNTVQVSRIISEVYHITHDFDLNDEKIKSRIDEEQSSKKAKVLVVENNGPIAKKINKKVRKALKEINLDDNVDLDEVRESLIYYIVMLDSLYYKPIELELAYDAIRYALILKQANQLYNDLETAGQEVEEEFYGFSLLLRQSRSFKDMYDKKVEKEYERTSTKVLGPALEDARKIREKILRYFEYEESKYNQKKKNKTKKIQGYRRFIEEISKLDLTKEITNYERIISNQLDKEFTVTFLSFVKRHNEKTHFGIKSEYDRLFSPEHKSYYQTLEEYHLPHDPNVVSVLMDKYTSSELKETLSKLKAMQITDPEVLFGIVCRSSQEIVNILDSFVQKQILTAKTLRENPILFSRNSSSTQNILRNINTFINNSLNPRYLSECESVLFTDPDTITQSVEALKDYSLLPLVNRETDINFLRDDLDEKLSIVSRANHLESINDNINLLNVPNTRWKRTLVMETMGMPVSKEELEAFLETDEFFIPDAKLDDYIEPVSPRTAKIYEKSTN